MITVDKNHISRLMLLEAYSKKHKTQERLNFFERKYHQTFSEFEKQLTEDEEVFNHFDDYMEWKAYANYLKELNLKIQELKSGNIRVA